jgi:hypothetical protein
LLGDLEDAQQSLKLIKSPVELICYSVVFMNYWAGLNNDADQVALRAGAESLIAVSMAARDANPPPGDRARLVLGHPLLTMMHQMIDLLRYPDPSLRNMKPLLLCCSQIPTLLVWGLPFMVSSQPCSRTFSFFVGFPKLSVVEAQYASSRWRFPFLVLLSAPGCLCVALPL